LVRRRQILVIGFGKDHCPEQVYHAAYEVGREIGKRGAVLLTGGLGGVMEAASHGAKDRGSLVVGIIPQDDKWTTNEFCDVVIATGLGHARDFLTAYSADAIVIVGGGVGTLIEAAAAYQKKIPIVALKGSGGVADRYADTYLDDRETEKIMGETSPEKAVDAAMAVMKTG
jgi:uncharacterized protein (TIGR00725 family)